MSNTPLEKAKGRIRWENEQKSTFKARELNSKTVKDQGTVQESIRPISSRATKGKVTPDQKTKKVNNEGNHSQRQRFL